MLYFRVIRYLKYLLLARHRRGHRIHSPFIFDLVSRIFRNKIDNDFVCNIEKVRQSLFNSKSKITVNDLGPGASSRNSNIRKVSEIAKISSIPIKYGVLLSNLTAEFGEPYVIELGTSFGICTMYLASSGSATKVITIEGCDTSAEIAVENFLEAGLKNIEVKKGAFVDILPQVLVKNKNPGLVFIGANNRKEPILDYFNIILESADSKTVIVIDNIYYSREMEEAWFTIMNSERVSVTIDLFRMGIVFLREGITPKNYIIRY